MSAPSTPKVKRSSFYDADVLAWLEERGKRIDRTTDWQLREAAREYMERKQAAEGQKGEAA